MAVRQKSLMQESAWITVLSGMALFFLGAFGAYEFADDPHALLPLASVALVGLLVISTAVFRLRSRLQITAALETQLVALNQTAESLPSSLVPILDKGPVGSGWNRLIQSKQCEEIDRAIERRVQGQSNHTGTEKFARALRSISEGIAISDRLGKLSYSNPAWSALAGGGQDESGGPEGGSIIEAFQPAGFQNWDEIQDQILAGTKPISVELHAGRAVADGVLQLSRFPLEGRAHEPEGYVWTLRNITQHAMARESHEQFLASATHELRTPLTNIRAYTESLIEMENISKQQQQEFFNIIYAEAGRLGRLLNQLLDIQQLEAGSMTIVPNPFDIRRMVQEVQDYIAPLIAAKKLNFVCRIAPDIKNIEADKEKVISCLINLLGNAIKYTPEGGEVRLAAEQQESCVTIAVEDTGIGISEEDLPKIFERFYRAQDERVAELEGNGLGLAFALEVARLHGGELKAESKLNEGSRFLLRLPVSARHA